MAQDTRPTFKKLDLDADRELRIGSHGLDHHYWELVYALRGIAYCADPGNDILCRLIFSLRKLVDDVLWNGTPPKEPRHVRNRPTGPELQELSKWMDDIERGREMPRDPITPEELREAKERLQRVRHDDDSSESPSDPEDFL